MSYKSLRDFLARLEKDGELIRVKEPVSTVLEMTEIQTRLIAKGGPAVIFEKPVKADGTPSDMPVLVNLFGTVKRVAMGVTLDGASAMIECGPDEAVLDAALRGGLDAPYSCAGGACGTCVATLRSGTVHMAVRHALTDTEVADGRILTCQARPTSDALTVDYDD